MFSNSKLCCQFCCCLAKVNPRKNMRGTLGCVLVCVCVCVFVSCAFFTPTLRITVRFYLLLFPEFERLANKPPLSEIFILFCETAFSDVRLCLYVSLVCIQKASFFLINFNLLYKIRILTAWCISSSWAKPSFQPQNISIYAFKMLSHFLAGPNFFHEHSKQIGNK